MNTLFLSSLSQHIFQYHSLEQWQVLSIKIYYGRDFFFHKEMKFYYFQVHM